MLASVAEHAIARPHFSARTKRSSTELGDSTLEQAPMAHPSADLQNRSVAPDIHLVDLDGQVDPDVAKVIYKAIQDGAR